MKESRSGSEPVLREIKAQTWMTDMDPDGSAEVGATLELGVAVSVNRYVWTTVNATCSARVKCSAEQYPEARDAINVTVLSDTIDFVALASSMWEAKSKEVKEQLEKHYAKDL